MDNETLRLVAVAIGYSIIPVAALGVRRIFRLLSERIRERGSGGTSRSSDHPVEHLPNLRWKSGKIGTRGEVFTLRRSRPRDPP